MGVYVLVSRLSPAPIHTKNGLFTWVLEPKVRNKLLFGTESHGPYPNKPAPLAHTGANGRVGYKGSHSAPYEGDVETGATTVVNCTTPACLAAAH